jgi:hypothetical protein
MGDEKMKIENEKKEIPIKKALAGYKAHNTRLRRQLKETKEELECYKFVIEHGAELLGSKGHEEKIEILTFFMEIFDDYAEIEGITDRTDPANVRVIPTDEFVDTFKILKEFVNKGRITKEEEEEAMKPLIWV